MSESKIRKYFPKPIGEVYTRRFILTVFTLAFLDLVTKYIATSTLSKGGAHSVDVLGEFLRFTLVFNDGAIFGLFSGNLIGSTVVMACAITLLLLLYWRENDALGSRTGWMLVMSGAMGNFIDKMFVKVPVNPADAAAETYWTIGMAGNRVMNKYVGVVDFLDVDLPDWIGLKRWFIFNVADMYISIGIGILLISMYKIGKEEAAERKAQSETK